MLAFNRVILTGRVATPPQCSYRPDGSRVIHFPLELDATKDRPEQSRSHGNGSPCLSRADSGSHSNRKRMMAGAAPVASGDLIQIVAMGKLAEVQLDLQRGQHLLVIGELHQRSWKTPEGKNRSRMEVIAMDLRTIDETTADTGVIDR